MVTDMPMTAPSPTRGRVRVAVYWVSTGAIAAEALVGGALDLARYGPYLRLLTDLGYPEWLATIMGGAKLIAGGVVLAPGLPRLKEWAYAGILINMLGAAASHLMAGRAVVNVIPPLAFVVVALVSWGTRPSSRRLAGPGALAA